MNFVYFASIFLSSAITILPYAAGCYITYWDELKLSPQRLIILLAILFSVETVLMGVISIQLSDFFFYILCIVNCLVLIKTVTAKVVQVLFVYLVFIQFAALIRGASFFIAVHMYNSLELFAMVTPFNTIPSNLIELCLATLIVIPLGLLLKKHLLPLTEIIHLRQWRILFILPLMFITLILISTFLLQDNLTSIPYLALLITIAVGSAATYAVVFVMLKGINDNAQLREENLSLGFREQYYALLSDRIEETKRARHDFRHHLRLLNTFLENGEYDKALAYLSEYNSIVHASEDIFYCKNNAINIILNYYCNQMHENGIAVTHDIRVPEKVFVKTSDLCVLISNCLENAIEGCLRQQSGEKKIQIFIKANENQMAVAIDNTCGEIRTSSNGEFLSTKANRKGIGLSSIQSIAEKHNGNAWFELESGMFKSSIVLYH